MKFLAPDSGFMRGLSDAVDAIWINILMLITSIPIITIGAALTAGHDATRRTLSGEGTATRNYFAAFRSNFAKSTGYWLIFGTTGALCVYSWIVLQITPLLIPKFALTICGSSVSNGCGRCRRGSRTRFGARSATLLCSA